MNFKIGYGFPNVPKVIIAYDLNTLVFVQTISYGLKCKIVSYMLVIWYRIELIFDCHDD